MTIYVGNLSYDLAQDDIKEAFAEYGEVTNIYVPKDRETGKLKGFAFVDMSSEAEEAKAIEELNEAEWVGRTLKVNKAKPRKNNTSSGNFSRESRS